MLWFSNLRLSVWPVNNQDNKGLLIAVVQTKDWPKMSHRGIAMIMFNVRNITMHANSNHNTIIPHQL